MHNFEKLDIWKLGMDIAENAHRLASTLPIEHRPGLADQIYRSAASIPANIAEGSAMRTAKSVRHYLRIALGSAAEMDTHLRLARRMQYAEPNAVTELLQQSRRLRAMIVGFTHRLVDQPADPIATRLTPPNGQKRRNQS